MPHIHRTINAFILGKMAPIEMPPVKNAKRNVSLEQKRWFLDRPEWKHARLAIELKSQRGGDWLITSTVRDWLKPDAMRRAHKSTAAVTSSVAVLAGNIA